MRTTTLRSRVPKTGALLLVLIAATIGLSSCGGSSSSSSTAAASAASAKFAPGTYQLLSFFPQANYNTWLRGQIAQFDAAHPGVTIKVQYTNPTYITQKVRTSVAAGAAPDVITLFPGSTTTQLWTAGRLLDFTPYLQSDAQWAQWTAGLDKVPRSEYSVGNHIFAVSVSNAPSMFWYWKSQLRAAGYNSFPASMNGLLALSHALRAHGMQPIVIGLNSQALFNFTYLWWALEANYDPGGAKGRLADNGQYSWTSPIFVDTANLLLHLYKSGLFYNPALEKNYDPDQKVDFGQMKGAMSWPLGPWMDGYYPRSAMSNIGVALLPPIAGAPLTVPGSTDQMFGIPVVTSAQHNPAHQHTMLAFVRQLSSPESQSALWQAGIFPILPSATKAPSTNYWAPLLNEQIKVIQPAKYTVDTYTYSPNTDNALSNGLEALLLGKTTVPSLLQAVETANQKDHPCAPHCS
jgi:raffinose/stachyose/melibiose transport system substrate-binding protein